MASNGEHNERNLSGQELPLSIMRLYLPRTGRFDSVVAKPKIEIIFFNGQRARLKSGLTKVSPVPGELLFLPRFLRILRPATIL